MPLTSQNLHWVKNVKSNGGTTWTYMDDEHQDEFMLPFSKHWQKGAARPNIGDVILLFQTTAMPGFKGTYLTHLVIPIEENAQNTGNPAFPKARLVRVIARASLPKIR
jgi:hypothetical protein